MKQKIKYILVPVAIALIALALLFFTHNSTYQNREISLFLENERDSYNYVEISLPKTKGSHPIIFLAHGFGGSIGSGGARDLAASLSDAGFIAVRIDFNPYTAKSLHADRVNSYSLSDMTSEALLAIHYVADHYNGDLDAVALYGRSYGGRLVMQMANSSAGDIDFQALALIAPAGDDVAFTRFLGGEEQYHALRDEAFSSTKGYSLKNGLHLTPEWFEDIESYNPCDTSINFGDKPVLLYYNTLDQIVYPDTALRCAKSYANCETIKVTSEDGHGFEMGYDSSELKDSIIQKVTEFFVENVGM
ncbi:alpha/beta hydrolase family protein [Eubacterium oxidoreducens]|uniref:Dienelactone hydrolase n=1 Tax=Eubacterium oxidoreducens TaxID=1732 RepID=A0A1G6CCV5_EUBOX|nr:prolyl oligopeptidase family serine peptidase [Eubacterium oxidoreducens]SDB30708.1 Dienelactone hydrolase [Eubacterium oxidoreducens]